MSVINRSAAIEKPREVEPLAALAGILIEALRALADHGQAEAANRLAGGAYAALRRTHPDLAQRINALMHRLSRIQERQQGADHA